MEIVQTILIGTGIVAALMACLWAYQCLRRDATIVDVGWSACTAIKRDGVFLMETRMIHKTTTAQLQGNHDEPPFENGQIGHLNNSWLSRLVNSHLERSLENRKNVTIDVMERPGTDPRDSPNDYFVQLI
jgi:hypothetical protein